MESKYIVLEGTVEMLREVKILLVTDNFGDAARLVHEDLANRTLVKTTSYSFTEVEKI